MKSSSSNPLPILGAAAAAVVLAPLAPSYQAQTTAAGTTAVQAADANDEQLGNVTAAPPTTTGSPNIKVYTGKRKKVVVEPQDNNSYKISVYRRRKVSRSARAADTTMSATMTTGGTTTGFTTSTTAAAASTKATTSTVVATTQPESDEMARVPAAALGTSSVGSTSVGGPPSKKADCCYPTAFWSVVGVGVLFALLTAAWYVHRRRTEGKAAAEERKAPDSLARAAFADKEEELKLRREQQELMLEVERQKAADEVRRLELLKTSMEAKKLETLRAEQQQTSAEEGGTTAAAATAAAAAVGVSTAGSVELNKPGMEALLEAVRSHKNKSTETSVSKVVTERTEGGTSEASSWVPTIEIQIREKGQE